MSPQILPPSTAGHSGATAQEAALVAVQLQDVTQSLTTGTTLAPETLVPEPSTIAMIALALVLAIVSVRLLGEAGRLSLGRLSR